jgi:hypothetical protein
MKLSSAFAWSSSLLVVFSLTSCASPQNEPAPLDVSEIAANTTEFQHQIIEDGEVTYAEYEKAVLAQRQCVQGTGAVPTELYEIGNNELAFDYEVRAADDETASRISSEADQCRLEYLVDVGRVWAYQQVLTEEQRDEMQPLVVACLNEAGLEIDNDADLASIVKAIGGDSAMTDAAQPCVKEYAAFFFVASGSSHAH